jgi:bifunctional NMN adenylyltransferase/nudix hydrolase
MKEGYGVIVGRFQVNDLHDGHMELFRQVRARHDGVIVFVGKHPAGLTKDNPLDFPTRKAMIQAKFPEFTVVSLPDVRTDEEWSALLDAKIGENIDGKQNVTLYGGRDSFVPHYSGRYKPVELALPIETMRVSGTDIRAEFANKVIESPEFRAGMIYAANHLWPVALAMVDIAILNSERTEICLGRKPGEKQFRFIGGHAEIGKTYEKIARQECFEEAGLDTGVMEYIGSAVIPDWRYRLADRGVTTSFFLTTTMSMGAVAGDDIEEVRWFKLASLKATDIVDTHLVLYAMLLTKLKLDQVLDQRKKKKAASC